LTEYHCARNRQGTGLIRTCRDGPGAPVQGYTRVVWLSEISSLLPPDKEEGTEEVEGVIHRKSIAILMSAENECL